MVTRPTNHMTSACDYSYDFNTWPTNFILISKVIIDSHICDIKLLSISSFALPFPYHDYIPISFIIAARVFSKSRNLAWASSRVLGGLQGRLPSGQRPIQIPMVVVWKEYPQLLLMKVINGSYREWWAEQLARQSISPTLEDVNISFNHLPYY